MSGVPTPVYPIVRPFGNSVLAPTDPGGATLPIPLNSQVAILVGAASFEDGFPAATMIDPEAGGIAPYGQDFNGISYMLSAYLAMIQAGQTVSYNAFAAGEFGGYKLGAVLARTGGGFWYNTVDANTTNPEGGGPVGWLGWNPTGTGYVAAVVPAGTSTDFNAGGNFDVSTRILDLNASAGAAVINGFGRGYDGQTVTVSNVGTDIIEIGALLGTAGSQVRLPVTLTLLQNMSFTMVYSAAAAGGAGLWIAN